MIADKAVVMINALVPFLSRGIPAMWRSGIRRRRRYEKGPHSTHHRASLLEPLEHRVLLDGSAPVFVDLLQDHVFTTHGALTIPINAFDADGDDLIITADSDSVNLEAFIPVGNRFARLNFVETDGGAPIGSILVELFEQRGAMAAERFIIHATNEVDAQGSLDPGGTPFYTDVLVHRTTPGLFLQTGDAINGDGIGAEVRHGKDTGPFKRQVGIELVVKSA